MHMRYLTIEQREALQAALKTRAELLRAGVASALDREDGGPGALPNHSEETDDDAIVDLETSLDVAQVSRATEELQQIDLALARLHSPEYGQCSDCGADIPFTRLQANPIATRCTGCQAEYERSHGSSTRSSI
jgi:DnaK suppressor protein